MKSNSLAFCAAALLCCTALLMPSTVCANDVEAAKKPEVSAVPAPPAAPPTSGTSPVTHSVKVSLTNNSSFAMSAKIFTRGSNRQWPSVGRAYLVPTDGKTHTFTIDCEEGEQICYGAWIQRARLRTEYGTGSKGLLSCPNCCRVCKADARDLKFQLNSSTSVKE